MSDHWVITFESVHFVMKAEKLLKGHGIEVMLIPTPRQISSDCGVALEVFEEDQNMIKKIFQKEALIPDEFYKKNRKKNVFKN